MKYHKIVLNRGFIGREAELSLLQELASGEEASIAVIHGRRRVGKTELVEQALREHNILKFEGREGQNEDYQRGVFLKTLADYTEQALLKKISAPSWKEVLEQLVNAIDNKPLVVFLEEFQWLSNYKSGLISELKVVWDNHLRQIPGLLLVICGSSPSFMIREVVYSRSLHNRSMYEIALKPFSLKETQLFLGERFSKQVVLDTYLTFGGVAEYLKYVRKANALIPAIAKNSFLPNSFFLREKSKIFLSALANKPHYELITDLLAKKRFLTRAQIAENLDISPGGNLSKTLKDLEMISLIESYAPLTAPNNSNNLRYRICDFYLQFYFRFIQPRQSEIEREAFIDSPNNAFKLNDYEQYLGFIFEKWGYRNSPLLAKILGFSAINYTSGAYFKRSTSKDNTSSQSGWQIDLAFKRADRVWTLCEFKHTASPIDVGEAKKIVEKFSKVQIKPKESIQRVLISLAGVSEAVKIGGYFDTILELEDIFI